MLFDENTPYDFKITCPLFADDLHVSQEEITVKDYIVFVDGDNFGFDHERVQQHKLSPTSTGPVNYLFDYVKKNRKFQVIKPRERNLKYQRVRFE